MNPPLEIDVVILAQLQRIKRYPIFGLETEFSSFLLNSVGWTNIRFSKSESGDSGKSILVPTVLFFLCTVVQCTKYLVLTPKSNVCTMYMHYGILYESYVFCRTKHTYFRQIKTYVEYYDWIDIFLCA